MTKIVDTQITEAVATPEQPGKKAKGKRSKKAVPAAEQEAIDVLSNALLPLPTEPAPVYATAKPTPTKRAARAKKVAPIAKVPAKKATKRAKPAKAGGRREQLIALLSRKGGARLSEIQKAFKYQAHSVRGAVSILRQDYPIESTRTEDGDRKYRIVK
jgi:hypothetical protein